MDLTQVAHPAISTADTSQGIVRKVTHHASHAEVAFVERIRFVIGRERSATLVRHPKAPKPAHNFANGILEAMKTLPTFLTTGLLLE